MIYIKKYKTEKGSIVAMCDQELLGRKYADKESGLELDLEKYADFYKGELTEAEKAKQEVLGVYVYSANIVGNESVNVMIDLGIAQKEDVRSIGGVPSLHIYRM